MIDDRWTDHPAPFIARIAYAEARRAIEDWQQERGIRTMTDDNTVEPLERRLAGVLSELEDAEVDLTTKEHKLAKQLSDVQTELDRLRSVKAAILGKPTPAVTKSSVGMASKTRQNKERTAAFVAGLSNGATFSARDLCNAIDVDIRGAGPILAGLVRRGVVMEAEGETESGHKLYQRA